MKKILFLSVCIFAANSLFAQPAPKSVGKDTNKASEKKDASKQNQNSTQTDANKTSEYESIVKKAAKDIQKEVSKLYKKHIKDLETENETLKSELSKTKESLKSEQTQCAEHKRLKDSLFKTSAELQANLVDEQRRSAQADSLTIEYIRASLKTKCSEKKIGELIGWFKQIKDDKLRDENYLKVLKLYLPTRSAILELANKELKEEKIRKAGSSDLDYLINNYRNELNKLPYKVEDILNNPFDSYRSDYLNKMLDISEKALNEKNMDLLKELLDM